jgi:hypothetical protein
MASLSSDKALFCLFHNDHMYLRPDDSPCSHIFSGVVRKSRKGLSVSGVDYDGQKMGIVTDILRREFNLVATLPVPVDFADRLVAIAEMFNTLGRKNLWPFYFSRDMEIRPKYERRGIPAITPEGEVFPPARQQNMDQYGAGVSELTLARINCVRMSLLTAQFAGLDVAVLAGLGSAFCTGEEVRDRIWQRTPRPASPEIAASVRFPVARGKGDPRLVLDEMGRGYLDHKSPIRIRDFLDGLEERIQGRVLFDQMVEKASGDILTNNNIALPRYLHDALELLAEKTPEKAKKREGCPGFSFFPGLFAPHPAKT